MDALCDVARRHGLRVVEDAALAHGARYKGKLVGTFGDVAEFSFATSKLVPGIEGGMLITDDEALLRRACALGSPERFRHRPEGPAAHAARRAGRPLPPEPATDEIAQLRAPYGHTYRMASICAVLARVSLAKLDARNAEVGASVAYLFDRLGEIRGLTPARPPAHVERVHNYVPPYLRYHPAAFGGTTAARFAAALRAEGAQVRVGGEFPGWASLHLQPVIAERRHMAFHHPANAESVARARYGPGTLPVTESPPGDRIWLPIFHRYDRDLLDQYVAAFEKVASHKNALV
jgi:dTDP-4-amino-4,6-dideoxygalactose transaminase